MCSKRWMGWALFIICLAASDKYLPSATPRQLSGTYIRTRSEFGTGDGRFTDRTHPVPRCLRGM
jgi:hypothetical protein